MRLYNTSIYSINTSVMQTGRSKRHNSINKYKQIKLVCDGFLTNVRRYRINWRGLEWKMCLLSRKQIGLDKMKVYCII